MWGGCHLLKIKNLHKYDRNQHVLKGINIEVKQQEVVALLGASSSGKSTLLRCLSNLEEIDEGEILHDGVKIDVLQKDIAIIYKSFNLFPHKTVLENVMEGPLIFQNESKDRAVVVGKEMLKKVRLTEKAYVYPKNLTDGEKQKVVIARALAMKPKLMLFDEPTALLDGVESSDILQVIKRIAKDGMTIVMATDEIDFVKDIVDRVVFLEDGMIVEESVTEEFFTHPKSVVARRFLDGM